MKTIVLIKSTHCQSCKILIEDIAKEIPGINSCNVDYKTGKTEIEHEDNIDWERFKREIENLGSYQIAMK